MKLSALPSFSFFSLFLACFCAGIPYLAASHDPPTPWAPHGSLSLYLQEKYLGLKVPELLNNEPMLWADLIVELPAGFYFNVFHSYGLDDNDFSSNFGDESDFIFGGLWPINDFKLGLSFAFYNLFPLSDWWRGDFLQFIITASRDFSLSENHLLTARLDLGWLTPADHFRAGAVTSEPALKHVWLEPFCCRPLTLTQELSLMWNSGLLNTGSEDLSAKYLCRFDWRLAENIWLTAPGFLGLLPLTNSNAFRQADKSVFAALTFAF